MATLHIDHSTDGHEDYYDIEEPTPAQIREAIQNCGVKKFTYVEITGVWQVGQHTIKSRLAFTRGVKNRFIVRHHIYDDERKRYLRRSVLDTSVDKPEREIPIILDNGEMSRSKIKRTADIEVAIAIATQFVEQGTFPENVEWSSEPDFKIYMKSLDIRR